jgi:uncharacterized membrane protein
MDATVSEWLNLVFRWVHVVAGVMWIGHLWFFNFVNAQLAKTYTPEGKKQVLPELMPRALYWFRWGALYTWVTGFLLLGIVYYMGGALVEPESGLSNGAGTGIAVAIMLFIFFVYDLLWKSPLGKNEVVAAAISFALVTGLLFAMKAMGYSGRSIWIHAGAFFGTIMAMNVWMRIWPAQRKIINGVKGAAPAPDASVAALAGLRSKHNTYMSVPLMLTMVSNHFPTVYGNDNSWIILAVLILVGWGMAKLMYNKSASAAPSQVPVPRSVAAVPPDKVA